MLLTIGRVNLGWSTGHITTGLDGQDLASLGKRVTGLGAFPHMECDHRCTASVRTSHSLFQDTRGTRLLYIGIRCEIQLDPIRKTARSTTLSVLSRVLTCTTRHVQGSLVVWCIPCICYELMSGVICHGERAGTVTNELYMAVDSRDPAHLQNPQSRPGQQAASLPQTSCSP